ncbi:MAG: sel1 repeat family protein [Tenericutes bacterium]|nr:sel1 repeat family protein [Mycoplasmatota bacterium]
MSTNALLEAINNYNLKNYKDAFQAFKKLAKTQTEAAYYLGMMYYNGYATNQDYSLAYKYFKQAWEGLYPDAIYMLGILFEFGRGVDKDLNQAFEYYQAAAKNESELALLKIAKFSEEGTVVEKSLKTAIEIYVLLTKKQNAYAMYKIGTFYLEGKGLKKSLDNAYSWLNKALSAGSLEAMNYFRFLGSKSKNDIRSKEEIFQTALSYIKNNNLEDSITLLEIAAKEKYLPGVIALSESYLLGRGVKPSPEKAFKTLLKYKELNEAELNYLIAKKYELGEGVDSSFIKAALFYDLAAKSGYELAKTALLEIRGY